LLAFIQPGDDLQASEEPQSGELPHATWPTSKQRHTRRHA